MKNTLKVMVAVMVASLALTGCNCFSNMANKQDQVKITCTPDVLALNNGKVSADITIAFPAEYYNKKAVLKVTPVMVFEGGQVTRPASVGPMAPPTDCANATVPSDPACA